MMFPQIYKGHLIFCQVYKCLTDMMFVIILPKLINVNNKNTSLHVIHIYNKSAVKKIHIISYQHIKKSYMYLFQNVYRYNSLVHIFNNFVFISIMFIVKIYIYIYKLHQLWDPLCSKNCEAVKLKSCLTSDWFRHGNFPFI